jgi:hypothetical protein
VSRLKTIFDGVTDTSKAFQVRRIELEEVGVYGGFDYYLNPA